MASAKCIFFTIQTGLNVFFADDKSLSRINQACYLSGDMWVRHQDMAIIGRDNALVKKRNFPGGNVERM